ncbi:MAG: hypothetical protein E6Q97_07260 [Desulfurellales bacterium]|nr:MAG: hypothetical protein E6Q97_07260 [Desulfurellales bacterium]
MSEDIEDKVSDVPAQPETEEVKPVAPELTPEQLAERTEKRRKFKELFMKLVDLNPNDAYDLLSEILSNVQTAIREEAKTRKFGELSVLPATLNEGEFEALSKEIIEAVKDQTLEEGANWLGAHANRINQTGRMKLNDMRVGDLGIEKLLLE